jgi:hypothetical protein
MFFQVQCTITSKICLILVIVEIRLRERRKIARRTAYNIPKMVDIRLRLCRNNAGMNVKMKLREGRKSLGQSL